MQTNAYPETAEAGAKLVAVLAYYRRIDRPGAPILHSWHELDRMGVQPAELVAINRELVRRALLRRVFHGPACYGDDSIFLA
jgi:hypothetical protein